MYLNPYGADAVLLAVDLVTDRPDSPGQLTRRCRDAGVVVTTPATAADFAQVGAFLDRWEQVVDAEDEADRGAQLNALLAHHSAHPRLTDHAGQGWHLHFRDDRLSLAGVVAALISVGTALHLTGRGMHRLSRCDVDGCRRIVADMSRTGRRRYCSTTCANRDAVRRHRARAAAGRR